jgi:AraC family transcriptional regulator
MSAPKFETRKEASIAYIEHRGPYDKVPWETYIERLYGWVKDQKVMPGFYPMGIYYDKPDTVPAERLRSDIAITFKGKANEKEGIKICTLPEMKVAAVSFKGPGTEFKTVYANLGKWIDEKGYEPSGPPIEIYSKKPEIVKGVTIIYTKVMMPVKKK